MDFKNLGENSPVYIVRRKPFAFDTGILKSKVLKPQNIYMPNSPQTLDVVVTVNGLDESLPAIPVGLEVVEFKNSFYSTTQDGAQQAVSNLIQMAKTSLDERGYYESVISEGEKVMERLNPQYAENKRQARTIEELVEHRKETDKKLDTILAKLNELFTPSK